MSLAWKSDRRQVVLLLQASCTSMRCHICDSNIVNCDGKQSQILSYDVYVFLSSSASMEVSVTLLSQI